MTRHSLQVVDNNRRPIQGAKVYVTDEAGLQPVLANDNGTPLSQPLLTDRLGTTAYNAPDGIYNHDVWFGGSLRYRETNVLVGSDPIPPVDFFKFVPRAQISAIRSATYPGDLTQAFESAIASGEREIIMQPGLYITDGGFTIPRTMSFRGTPGQTEIRVRSTTVSGIRVANGVSNPGLSGLKVTREGVPTSTAHGIEFLGTTDKAILEWLVLEGHYDNLRIGTCDTGTLRHIDSRFAHRYGVFQTNASFYGPSQWDADTILVEKCDGDGWRMQSTDGPPGLVPGAMRNIKAFGCSGHGFRALGSATTPIQDLRLSDAFMGECGFAAVKLDTFGGNHSIQGFFERSGMIGTGRLIATQNETAATMNAPNVHIGPNNVDVTIEPSRINTASYDGVLHEGGVLTMASGSTVVNNGNANFAGRRNGILSTGGELIVGGCKIGNLVGSAQAYGVATNHGNASIVGNRLDNNSLGPLALGQFTSATVLANNTPNTVPTYPAPSGGTPTPTPTPTDTTPDAFSFADQANVALGSYQSSNTITVSGLGDGQSAVVTISGGVYSKNGGLFVATTTTAINGDTFSVAHNASGSNATATNTTLTIGGVSDTFTSTTVAAAVAAPTAPVLTRTSAAGAAPLSFTTGLNMSDTFAGNIIHYQVASDAGFTTITQDIAHFLTPSEVESQDISITGDGFFTPSGLYYLRARVERDDAITSAWSNVLTDTVAVTTIALDPANKNASATLTNANRTVTGANQGAPQLARSTIQIAGKRYAEFHADTIQSGGAVSFGVCDAAASMTDFSTPGSGNAHGGGLKDNGYIYPTTAVMAGFLAQGDTGMLAVDVPATLTNPGKFWIGLNGVWKNGDPSAGTGGESLTLAQWYLWVGVNRVDALTLNGGNAPFTYTKPTGFSAMP